MFKKKKGPIITLGLGQPTVPGPGPAAGQPGGASTAQPPPPPAPVESVAPIVEPQPAPPASPPGLPEVPPPPPAVDLQPVKSGPVTTAARAAEAPAAPVAPKAREANRPTVEATTDFVQCPFCLATLPGRQGRCEHCGNLIPGVAAEPPAPAPPPPPVPAPAVAVPAEPAVPPAGEAPAPLAVECDTRKLTVKPTPSVLKETTLFTPAQITLLDDPRKPAGQTYDLKIGQTRIGRGQDNDLPFPDEEFISRHHCEIAYHKYQYVLRDLQSANGSYVNDVRVRETILRDGDTIQIGSMRFLFEDPVEKMKKRKAGTGQSRDSDA